MVTAVVPFAASKRAWIDADSHCCGSHACRRRDPDRRIIRSEFEIGRCAFAGDCHFLRRDVAITEVSSECDILLGREHSGLKLELPTGRIVTPLSDTEYIVEPSLDRRLLPERFS